MTKVPPPRAPPPSRPSRPTTTSDRLRRPRAADQAQKAKAPKMAPQGAEGPPGDGAEVKVAEAGSESGGGSAEQLDRELEKHAPAWAPDDKSAQESKAVKDDELAEQERAGQKDSPKPADKKPQTAAKPRPGEPTPPKGRPSDGFESKADPLKQVLQQSMRTAAALAAKAVAAALPALPAPPPVPRPGKPPDAMSVLHSAKEPGVYFKEDAHRDGHSEEEDDPELADAVEECIRLLFGVRGIHRVGPGRNEAGEQVILVVTNRGFGEGSLKRVPEKVHRFPTLLALPYELLPLRRDR